MKYIFKFEFRLLLGTVCNSAKTVVIHECINYFWNRKFKAREEWSLRSNSVTRQVHIQLHKKGGSCQNVKIEMRHFG